MSSQNHCSRRCCIYVRKFVNVFEHLKKPNRIYGFKLIISNSLKIYIIVHFPLIKAYFLM
jgi:hypothetical protein